MGYIEDDSMIRVDFFKESGKWYATEGMKWTGSYAATKIGASGPREGWDVDAQFRVGLYDLVVDASTGRVRYAGMIAVCLHPYHTTSFPLMHKVDDAIKVERESRRQ